MKTIISILGTTSQSLGPPPPPEIFFFPSSMNDFGDLGGWFMDDASTIPASRVPGVGDDVVIGGINSLSPSLAERTYKSIVFSNAVSCYNGSNFFKCGVKFIASGGSITGNPTSLIADLETDQGITFNSGLSVPDIAVNNLAGAWVSSTEINLTGYHHCDGSLLSLYSAPTSINTPSYTCDGCCECSVPNNAGVTPNSVSVTMRIQGVGSSVTIERATSVILNNACGSSLSFVLAPNSGDSITSVLLESNSSVLIDQSASLGTVGGISINTGTLTSCYFDGTNVSLSDAVVVGDIEVHNANLNFDSISSYIAARISGNITVVSGDIFINGYPHIGMTLSGGITSSASYDLLVYDGTGYQLFDTSNGFFFDGTLTFSGHWNLVTPIDSGFWDSGEPPNLLDWSLTGGGSSGEPTFGTE
jgi:hypothetical protein